VNTSDTEKKRAKNILNILNVNESRLPHLAV